MQPRRRRDALIGVADRQLAFSKTGYTVVDERHRGRPCASSVRGTRARQIEPRTAARNATRSRTSCQSSFGVGPTRFGRSRLSGSRGSGRTPHDTTVDGRCCLNAATPSAVTAVSLIYRRRRFGSFASAVSVRSPTAVFERSRLVTLCSDSNAAAAESLMPSAFHRLRR